MLKSHLVKIIPPFFGEKIYKYFFNSIIMPKKSSYFQNGSYKGYKIKLILIRENSEQYEPVSLNTPSDVYSFIKDIQHFDREKLYSIHINTRNLVIGLEEISSGSQTQSIVHPREVFKSAILNSADSIIIAHNHPSGDPTPSKDDQTLTEKLYDCGELLGIPVIDSVIIGYERYYSFLESGCLGFLHG
jgi:DNA repair protein RadC